MIGDRFALGPSLTSPHLTKLTQLAGDFTGERIHIKPQPPGHVAELSEFGRDRASERLILKAKKRREGGEAPKFRGENARKFVVADKSAIRAAAIPSRHDCCQVAQF